MGFSHGQVCKHLAAVNKVSCGARNLECTDASSPIPNSCSTLQLTPPGGLFARPVWRKDSGARAHRPNRLFPFPRSGPASFNLLAPPPPRVPYGPQRSPGRTAALPRAHSCAARGWLRSRRPFCSRGLVGREGGSRGAGRLGGTHRGFCHRRHHHHLCARGAGKEVNPGREPVAAPLREGRRWEGDGGYR